MLMFDEKLLIVIMGVLLVGMTIKFTVPQIQAVFGLDLILFFVGALALMTMFHMYGFIEGYKEGLRDGQATMY